MYILFPVFLSFYALRQRLHLSEDVAGATFMAAGSSAPELFTSVIGEKYTQTKGVNFVFGSEKHKINVVYLHIHCLCFLIK